MCRKRIKKGGGGGNAGSTNLCYILIEGITRFNKKYEKSGKKKKEKEINMVRNFFLYDKVR